MKHAHVPIMPVGKVTRLAQLPRCLGFTQNASTGFTSDGQRLVGIPAKRQARFKGWLREMPGGVAGEGCSTQGMRLISIGGAFNLQDCISKMQWWFSLFGLCMINLLPPGWCRWWLVPSLNFSGNLEFCKDLQLHRCYHSNATWPISWASKHVVRRYLDPPKKPSKHRTSGVIGRLGRGSRFPIENSDFATNRIMG